MNSKTAIKYSASLLSAVEVNVAALADCAAIAIGFTAKSEGDKSVFDFMEVDLRLALGGFSKRDDADFMFILRVYN